MPDNHDRSDLEQAQRASAAATERLQLALAAGKSVGWDWDLASNRVTWFGDLPTMFGIDAATHVGGIEDFRRFVHPDDRGMVWKAVETARQSRAPYVAEYRLHWPDGTVRWVAARGQFHYASNGEPERMLGMAADVTERKQHEESLALFRSLIDASGEALEIIDPITLRFLDVNEQACRDLGRSRDELLSLTIADIDPAVDGSQIGEAARRRRHSEFETFESVHRRKDGSTFPVEVSLKHVVLDRGYCVCVVRDITERRQAQQALRESEERLRLAAETGHMFAYAWDAATDQIVRSGGSAHILRIEESAPISGAQVLAKIHSADRERVVATLAALTPAQPYLRIAYRMVHPDASVIWVERNSRAYFDEAGSLVRIIGMVADITERKKGEEALSSLGRRLIEAQEAERARIARDLHDDIGQRLAVLGVALHEMNRLTVDAPRDVRGSMDAIQRQAAEISVDVQALSHELHSSKLQLLGLVAAMRSFCVELSGQEKVEVDFSHDNVPGALPREVSLCLFRVLQEALRNAVRHSTVKRFAVHLRGTPDAVRLTVRDTGIGFDPETAAQGRGLGLASMKERLTVVGGTLAVESRLNKGTTVVGSVPTRKGG